MNAEFIHFSLFDDKIKNFLKKKCFESIRKLAEKVEDHNIKVTDYLEKDQRTRISRKCARPQETFFDYI